MSGGSATLHKEDPFNNKKSSESLHTICGTHFGETKAPTSIVEQPAWKSRSINSTFSAIDTGLVSFCKPSRGPTSTILAFVVIVRIAVIGVIEA